MLPPPPPEPARQRLVAGGLILLGALGVILLLQEIFLRSPGKSHSDWSAPASPKP